MVAWLPAVKAILPYVGQIVTTAIPAFTKKSDKSSPEEVINKQIAELQEAATRNAESLKALASQLQQVLGDMDSGSAKIDKEIRTIKQLSMYAIALSCIAIVLWLASWLH